VAVVWFGWGQHRVRAVKLKRPFDAYLCYSPDDADEFWDLHVPANSHVMVQVRIRPTIAYRQAEIIFGFYGDREKRPRPWRVLNRFIQIGINRQQDPYKNPTNYIDNDNHYHIVTTADRSPGNTQTVEFVVETKQAGKFPVLLGVITDSSEAMARNDLHITVVEHQVAAAHLATPEIHS
jgi:hypothetical protein